MSDSDKIKELAKTLRIQTLVDYQEIINPKSPFDRNLLNLLELESIRRFDIRFSKRLKEAKFPVTKTFDTFELDKTYFPNLNFEEVTGLFNCDFIKKREDIVAVGPSGRGKSHLALAVGYEAVKKGYKVHYKQADQMLLEMEEARSEKALGEYVDKIIKFDLLIIDEIGYLNYNEEKANLLFKIITCRHEIKSTIFTTNYDLSKWNQFIGNDGLSIAIIDRIAHHSIILDMNGPKSYRLLHSRSKQTK
jgi:DNA replication protein DnaC